VDRLISVVEEQAQALVRTAFSTSVREAGDLSAGVYNARARCWRRPSPARRAMSTRWPMRWAISSAASGANMAEGDVYITNDPWEGTGHKHDITVVTPVFHDGTLIGFFACTAHVTDIGGRGFGADANDVHEEGLYIPIMRFADGATVDRR
jgi:N-methylhydantoinase B